jgi:hypothetical protein
MTIYRTHAIITQFWLKTVDFRPTFPCLVHKLSLIWTDLRYKPHWKMGWKIYKSWLVHMVVLIDDLRLIFSNLNVAVNGARWYSGDFYASSYLLHFCPNQPLCIQCFLTNHHKLKCGEVVMELKSRHYNFIMNHHEFYTFLTFKFVR